MRLLLVIAYDGQPFSGWQSQPGVPTIQDLLSVASKEICGESLLFHGSGRTDAGVHALGQVAHLDLPADNSMSPADWRSALNAHLPAEIRIIDACEAPANFHAQYSAKQKLYRYRIANCPVLPPQLAGRAWHLYGALDKDLMEQAAAVLTGTHDFRRFSATRGKARDGKPQDPDDTRRQVFSITIRRHLLADAIDCPVIDFEFCGSGFLYKMVRMLTGSIAKCAQGRLEISEIEGMLREPATGERCRHNAPADGLSLVRVEYPFR